MDLLAILIGDGGVVGGAGVGSEDDAVFVDEAYDGGSGFGGEGEDGLGGGGIVAAELVDEGVAVDVVEGESSGGGVGVDADVGVGEFGHDWLE